MVKIALPLAKSEDTISVYELVRFVSDLLFETEYRGASESTREKYRLLSANLLWFFNDKQIVECGQRELKQFFLYVREGHKAPRGRWGNSQNKDAVRPSTVTTYFTVMRTLFRYIVNEGGMAQSPMERLERPIARADQIQPFAMEEVTRLVSAARRSRHPRRDEAIVRMLLDSAMRVSELCGLTFSNVDHKERVCRVLGKGNKYRAAHMGMEAARSLFQYLRETAAERAEDGAIFLSDRGMGAGQALTRFGVRQIIARLGKDAQISTKRCSPHTFRHTFAIEFLRNGGNVFTLKEILGHTSLTMCNKYVALAAADIETQHRQFSPSDRLRRRPKR